MSISSMILFTVAATCPSQELRNEKSFADRPRATAEAVQTIKSTLRASGVTRKSRMTIRHRPGFLEIGGRPESPFAGYAIRYAAAPYQAVMRVHVPPPNSLADVTPWQGLRVAQLLLHWDKILWPYGLEAKLVDKDLLITGTLGSTRAMVRLHQLNAILNATLRVDFCDTVPNAKGRHHPIAHVKDAIDTIGLYWFGRRKIATVDAERRTVIFDASHLTLLEINVATDVFANFAGIRGLEIHAPASPPTTSCKFAQQATSNNAMVRTTQNICAMSRQAPQLVGKP